MAPLWARRLGAHAFGEGLGLRPVEQGPRRAHQAEEGGGHPAAMNSETREIGRTGATEEMRIVVELLWESMGYVYIYI